MSIINRDQIRVISIFATQNIYYFFELGALRILSTSYSEIYNYLFWSQLSFCAIKYYKLFLLSKCIPVHIDYPHPIASSISSLC